MTVRPRADTAVAEADLQQQVLDFLDGSSFGPAKGGKRIDTHASMVFLGADRALKIKRAVRLPFLDYSTLEKRRRACEEELKVNAGNAPELYRRVIAITRNFDGTFEIDGTGTPVEWAVEMARFDESQSLDRVAVSKTIDPSLAMAVADAILRSHDKAPRADGESWLASIPPIIERNTAKFRTVRGLDAVAVDRLDAASRDAVTILQPLLTQRAKQGFVRRCHGDLHLANIALVDGRPLLFDAIEFDPVIATTDVLYDLAFTLMDLVHFNQAAAANEVFNRYLAGAGDECLDGLRLLPLFLSVRAAIRAHVLFMKSEQAGGNDAAWQEAKRYLDLAGRLRGRESRSSPAGSRVRSSLRPARSLSARTSFASTYSAPVKPRPCRNPPTGQISRSVSTARFRAPRSVSSPRAARSCSMPSTCRKRNGRKSRISRPLVAYASPACFSRRISRRGWRGSNSAGTMHLMQHGMLPCSRRLSRSAR